jgi:hypothetical protein
VNLEHQAGRKEDIHQGIPVTLPFFANSLDLSITATSFAIIKLIFLISGLVE